VTDKNVHEVVSVCGMRLEHMHNVLNKIKVMTPYISERKRMLRPNQYMNIDYNNHVRVSSNEPKFSSLVGFQTGSNLALDNLTTGESQMNFLDLFMQNKKQT